MSKFVISPHFRLQEWVAEEKGYFRAEGLDYEFRDNYGSVDEAKAAIDLYFEERNLHFRENPRRAGKKIWGKERVPPEFSEGNNCKDPLYR